MIEFECWESQPDRDDRGVVVDRTGRIVDASPGWRRAPLFEGDRVVEGETVGRRISDLHTPEVGAELLALVERHCDARSGFIASLMHRGSWIQILATPVEDGGGEPRLRCRASMHMALLGSVDGIEGISAYRLRSLDLGPLARLSLRELEVMKLIGDGLQSVEIARLLHRSVRTVQGHRRSIGKKLGLSTRAAIAKQATHAGLTIVPLDRLASFLGMSGASEPAGSGAVSDRPARLSV